MSSGGIRPATIRLVSLIFMSRGLLTLFSVVVLDLVGFGIVVPILPFIAQQFGASASVLGLLLTSYSAMQFCLAPAWGRLSDRIGRRKVMLLTMVGSCLSLVILGSADSLALLFVGRLLTGVFAANVSVASAYVTDITTEANRAQGMGLIGASFGIGFILGPALGGLLSKFGYAIPIYVAAGLTALNLISAAIRLPEPKRHEPSTEDLIPHPRVLSIKPVFKLCLIYFIFSLALTQLESVFAYFMIDRFRYDALHVAYILAMMAAIMVAIQGGLIKNLTRRFGENPLLVFGIALMTVAFAFIPLAPTVFMLLIPLASIATGRALAQPPLLSFVSKKAPVALRGAVMGTFHSSASLARVLGPTTAGLLYDRWAPSPFYLAAGLMGLVLLVTVAFRPE